MQKRHSDVPHGQTDSIITAGTHLDDDSQYRAEQMNFLVLSERRCNK